jgi:hypothetical protein
MPYPSGGAAVLDKDCYLTYTSPGPIADGQIIDEMQSPTTDRVLDRMKQFGN